MENLIDTLIGDVPVAEQLATALERMASKEHKHENYITCEEFEKLKQVVENLVDLVGDESVANQINNVIKNLK